MTGTVKELKTYSLFPESIEIVNSITSLRTLMKHYGFMASDRQLNQRTIHDALKNELERIQKKFTESLNTENQK